MVTSGAGPLRKRRPLEKLKGQKTPRGTSIKKEEKKKPSLKKRKKAGGYPSGKVERKSNGSTWGKSFPCWAGERVADLASIRGGRGHGGQNVPERKN